MVASVDGGWKAPHILCVRVCVRASAALVNGPAHPPLCLQRQFIFPFKWGTVLNRSACWNNIKKVQQFYTRHNYKKTAWPKIGIGVKTMTEKYLWDLRHVMGTSQDVLCTKHCDWQHTRFPSWVNTNRNMAARAEHYSLCTESYQRWKIYASTDPIQLQLSRPIFLSDSKTKKFPTGRTVVILKCKLFPGWKRPGRNRARTQLQFQKDLTKLREWTACWQMQFSVNKCRAIRTLEGIMRTTRAHHWVSYESEPIKGKDLSIFAGSSEM